jgi:hypothetical protein
VQRIGPAHAKLAKRLADELGMDEFRHTLEVLERLSKALDVVSR